MEVGLDPGPVVPHLGEVQVSQDLLADQDLVPDPLCALGLLQEVVMQGLPLREVLLLNFIFHVLAEPLQGQEGVLAGVLQLAHDQAQLPINEAVLLVVKLVQPTDALPQLIKHGLLGLGGDTLG
jgi:hypothetical protein